MTSKKKSYILTHLKVLFVAAFASLATVLIVVGYLHTLYTPQVKAAQTAQESYWLVLHRKSNTEYLYYGEPGSKEKSSLIKIFQVKPGVPGEKPTPLPSLLNRDYWLITKKEDSSDNPETAPYFLMLDVPVSDEAPYGPTPYNECNGQCNWELPGYFGLHGVAGQPSRVAKDNRGSSGCVRHTDEDIVYLYNLLDPENSPVRYYVEDN